MPPTSEETTFPSITKGETKEWILFAQSARYEPYFTLPGLTLSYCKYLGDMWILQTQIRDGIYSCCQQCKVKKEIISLVCEECYAYDEAGFVTRDKMFFPIDLFWGNLPLDRL